MDISELRLSASSLKSYEQCPRKFYFSKIKKEKPTHEQTVHPWVGTIVHNSIYSSIADYKDGAWVIRENPRTLEQVKAFFDAVWDADTDIPMIKSLAEDGEIDIKKPAFEAYSPTKSGECESEDCEKSWKTTAWGMVVNGYEIVNNIILKLDGLESIKIEEELTFEDYGTNFLGYIDVLAITKHGVAFFDFKTSKKPLNPDLDIQFYLYRRGLRNLLNLNYYPVGYYVYLRGKKLIPAKSTSIEDFKKMDEKIEDILSGIASEEFYPAKGSFVCKFCEYRGLCYGNFDTRLSIEELAESLSLPTYVEFEDEPV